MTIATNLENKPEGKISKKHHCLRKRPEHVRTSRCLRLGHVVQCPIHSDSFPLRLSECVKCNSADKRQVQQERKDRKKQSNSYLFGFFSSIGHVISFYVSLSGSSDWLVIPFVVAVTCQSHADAWFVRLHIAICLTQINLVVCCSRQSILLLFSPLALKTFPPQTLRQEFRIRSDSQCMILLHIHSPRHLSTFVYQPCNTLGCRSAPRNIMSSIVLDSVANVVIVDMFR